MLTVREAIELLSQQDPNAQVVLLADEENMRAAEQQLLGALAQAPGMQLIRG